MRTNKSPLSTRPGSRSLRLSSNGGRSCNTKRSGTGKSQFSLLTRRMDASLSSGPKRSSSRSRKSLKPRCGLSLEEYEKQLSIQGGVCAICHQPPKKMRLSVDHSHRSRLIRGLLCYRCNHFVIGAWLDNADLHRSAAAYLENPPFYDWGRLAE